MTIKIRINGQATTKVTPTRIATSRLISSRIAIVGIVMELVIIKAAERGRNQQKPLKAVVHRSRSRWLQAHFLIRASYRARVVQVVGDCPY
jgi:hypothetical protein